MFDSGTAASKRTGRANKRTGSRDTRGSRRLLRQSDGPTCVCGNSSARTHHGVRGTHHVGHERRRRAPDACPRSRCPCVQRRCPVRTKSVPTGATSKPVRTGTVPKPVRTGTVPNPIRPELSRRHRTRDDGLSHDHMRFDDRPPDDRVSHNRLPDDNGLSPACSDAVPALMATAAALCACCFR